MKVAWKPQTALDLTEATIVLDLTEAIIALDLTEATISLLQSKVV